MDKEVTPDQPRPYTCKHDCERDALKDMILKQAENAATAAKEYAENMAALREALLPFCDFADFEDCPGVMLELNDFRNDDGKSLFALARQALGQPT